MSVVQISKQLFLQCLHDRCMQIAAALAYATLLALIPMSVLLYKVSDWFFVANDGSLVFQQVIVRHLSPTSADQLQQFLLSVTRHAASLGWSSTLVLLLSVLAMMHTIDTGLNRIWKTAASGYQLNRLAIYLGLLIFFPLVIASSVFLSTYLASLPFLTTFFSPAINTFFLNALSFLILWFAFLLLYKWVPRCRVDWRYAFAGASAAVVLFELAKQLFTVYVGFFNTYEILYGALAAIPLLLIWIYLSWLIVLFGAQLAHYLQYQR